MKEERSYKFYVQQIASILKREELSFFVGAGMSIPCGLPGFSGLMKDIAQSQLPSTDYAKDASPVDLADLLEARISRVQLLREIKKRVENKASPGESHAILAAIARRMRVDFIATTNWDDLLYQSITGDFCERICTPHDLQISSQRKTIVAHLHGSLINADTIRVTSADMHGLLNSDSTLIRMLQERYRAKSFLFLGYSGSDWNILSFLIKTKNAVPAGLSRRHYCVCIGSDLDPMIEARATNMGAEIIDLSLFSDASPSERVYRFLSDVNASCDYHDVSNEYYGVSRKFNPYLGLRSFSPMDSELFFGREKERAEILSLVTSNRVVTIAGASGVGKSSLINAGISPLLLARHPGSKFVSTVASHKEKALLPIVNAISSSDVSDENALSVDLLEASLKRQKVPHLFVHFDQAEVLATKSISESDSVAIFSFLEVLARSNMTTVIITLRWDLYVAFFRRANQAGEFGVLSGKCVYTLHPPSKTDLLSVIKGPAALYGARFDESVAREIVNDCASIPSPLPLLGFCLKKIFDNAAGFQRITKEDYAAFGKLNESIDNIIEDAASISGIDFDRTFVRIATGMAEIIEDSEKITKKTLCLLDGSEENVEAFLNVLTSSGLVTKVSADGYTNYEFAHDVVPASWRRFQTWVLDHRAFYVHRNALIRDVFSWVSLGKTEKNRWSGERCVRTSNVLRKFDHNFTGDECEFLGACDIESIMSSLSDTKTSQVERALLSDKIDFIGDSRDGVLTKQGLPDISWVQIGEENSDINGKSGFEISSYPITISQFRAFIDADDGYFQRMWWKGAKGFHNAPGPQLLPRSPSQPVVNVDLHEARAFCMWISHKTNRHITVPTLEQWRQAYKMVCGNLKYPWGDEFDQNYLNTIESGLGRILCVGAYPPPQTQCNVNDMLGNTWEWIDTLYENDGKVAGDTDGHMVAMGGSWDYPLIWPKTNDPYHSGPDYRFYNLGFRVVRAKD